MHVSQRSSSGAPSDDYCRSAWTAVCRSQAVIEFDLFGTITWANARFLELVGYRLDQIVARHHRILCTAELADSDAYKAFWDRLRQGEFDQGEYRPSLAKGGS